MAGEARRCASTRQLVSFLATCHAVARCSCRASERSISRTSVRRCCTHAGRASLSTSRAIARAMRRSGRTLPPRFGARGSAAPAAPRCLATRGASTTRPPPPASKLPPKVGRRSHRVAPRRRRIVKSSTAATDLTMLRRGAFGKVSRRPTEPPGRRLGPPELSHSTTRRVHIYVCRLRASVGVVERKLQSPERVASSSVATSIHKCRERRSSRRTGRWRP